jgi:predicted N-formylglutamate amidohydrolase
MLAIHDHVTRQMFDRLETTAIGLGLVRLLQDAKRFEEARRVLYSLESGFQSAKAIQKPCKAIRLKRTTRTASAQIDAA